MLYNDLFSNLDPSKPDYNPCGDGVRGCLLCLLAALEDLETDTKTVSENLTDKERAELLQLRVYQLKQVLMHALYREFFLEVGEV